MTIEVKEKINIISNRFIETVCDRLAENKQVRRSLPEWGRVHIDRQLPFICIYRQQKNDINTLSDWLITGEASYLTATGNPKQHKQISSLVKNIARTLKENFGSFLIVEVWLSNEENQNNNLPTYNGAFKIYTPKKNVIPFALESLERSLKEIKIRKKLSEVEIISATKISPPGMPALVSQAEAKKLGFHTIGIEVKPVFKNKVKDQVYPLIQRKLEKGFARALKYSFFEFTRNHTPLRPPNYQSLGRRSMVKAVWEVDRQLAEISNEFDFLLQVTPVNNQAAWSAFQRSKFERTPQFIYRPLSVDPILAKRKLYKIPIERIEDPTLAQLFREQQLELDRKITMLNDRGNPNFLYGSLQVFGTVEDSFMKVSTSLLEQIQPRSRNGSSVNSIDAREFACRVTQKIDHFRTIIPGCTSKVIIRKDITGLLVSKGNVLIGDQLKIPEARVDALIAHEIETHVLTYINGKAQPFHQLYIGLPGYEELQEGLAVLAEYMVDGITGSRMRLLAARVIAARHLIDDASFIEVFRVLNKGYGFEQRTAFNITSRIFRSGGFTKDAIYLRGLIQLLDYLKNDGELEPLFVGKFSTQHIAIIRELQFRKVLQPAPLRPEYLDDPKINNKLNDLRKGLTLINLIKRRK